MLPTARRLFSVAQHLKMSSPPSIAVIAGVGPGTGASIALRFAKQYPVALLSRTPQNHTDLVEQINKSGGQAVGIPTDVSDRKSVESMITAVKDKWGKDVNVAAAIFNASGKFARKPFLELEAEDMQSGIDGTIMGAFNFSQCLLPLLLKHEKGEHPATVVFTGATASVKGSARFASFAGPKFALRAMAQSLAREFGPQGVHVAHAVIDGVIDIPRTKGWDLGEGGKISPDAIADAYWHLHTQPKTAFTFEIDIRPSVEKW